MVGPARPRSLVKTRTKCEVFIPIWNLGESQWVGSAEWQLKGMTPPKKRVGVYSRPGKVQMVLKFKQVNQT